jgi:hypothetical protein
LLIIAPFWQQVKGVFGRLVVVHSCSQTSPGGRGDHGGVPYHPPAPGFAFEETRRSTKNCGSSRKSCINEELEEQSRAAQSQSALENQQAELRTTNDQL